MAPPVPSQMVSEVLDDKGAAYPIYSLHLTKNYEAITMSRHHAVVCNAKWKQLVSTFM
jgi:hypothetical protein